MYHLLHFLQLGRHPLSHARVLVSGCGGIFWHQVVISHLCKVATPQTPYPLLGPMWLQKGEKG